jgi:hypothetical protein
MVLLLSVGRTIVGVRRGLKASRIEKIGRI